METSNLEFLFLGGPAHGKKLLCQVDDLGLALDDYDIYEFIDGHGYEKFRYNKRKFVSPTGFVHVIYCDSRLSTDQQNAIIHKWASEEFVNFGKIT